MILPMRGIFSLSIGAVHPRRGWRLSGGYQSSRRLASLRSGCNSSSWPTRSRMQTGNLHFLSRIETPSCTYTLLRSILDPAKPGVKSFAESAARWRRISIYKPSTMMHGFICQAPCTVGGNVYSEVAEAARTLPVLIWGIEWG